MEKKLVKTILIAGGIAAFAGAGVAAYLKRQQIKELVIDIKTRLKPTGKDEVLGADSDGDGEVDVIAADTTGDGQIDTVIVDTDGDGIADTALVDLDGDGTLDVAVDISGESSSEALPSAEEA